jgi:hypothetical protein
LPFKKIENKTSATASKNAYNLFYYIIQQNSKKEHTYKKIPKPPCNTYPTMGGDYVNMSLRPENTEILYQLETGKIA